MGSALQALEDIDRDSEPQCGQEGFFKRAVTNVLEFTGLTLLVVIDTAVFTLATWCCCKVQFPDP